ncbi:MAG: DUF1175 family protein [Vicinamibacteraceae bacterium]
MLTHGLLASGVILAASFAAACGADRRPGERADERVSRSRATSDERARRSPDAADREAFRAWFVLLADAQFYRPTTDVTDCAGLVRHAAREALRPHGSEWLRRMRLPLTRLYPEIVNRPMALDGMLPIFRVGGWWRCAPRRVRGCAHDRARQRRAGGA